MVKFSIRLSSQCLFIQVYGYSTECSNSRFRVYIKQKLANWDFLSSLRLHFQVSLLKWWICLAKWLLPCHSTHVWINQDMSIRTYIRNIEQQSKKGWFEWKMHVCSILIFYIGTPSSRASIAQRQSTGLVNQGSWVQFSLEADFFSFSCLYKIRLKKYSSEVYFLLLVCKSSIWFTEKHIFKIIIYFFNTSKCVANYVISFLV